MGKTKYDQISLDYGVHKRHYRDAFWFRAVRDQQIIVGVSEQDKKLTVYAQNKINHLKKSEQNLLHEDFRIVTQNADHNYLLRLKLEERLDLQSILTHWNEVKDEFCSYTKLNSDRYWGMTRARFRLPDGSKRLWQAKRIIDCDLRTDLENGEGVEPIQSEGIRKRSALHIFGTPFRQIYETDQRTYMIEKKVIGVYDGISDCPELSKIGKQTFDPERLDLLVDVMAWADSNSDLIKKCREKF